MPRLGRAPSQLVGGWEAGLLVLMALLYFGGAFVNPTFFGSTEALHALLRDTSRYGIIAVGMTFVIVNKDLDLSVGSDLRPGRRGLRRLFRRRAFSISASSRR